MSCLRHVLDFYGTHSVDLNGEPLSDSQNTDDNFADQMREMGYRPIREGDTYNSLSLLESVYAGMGWVRDR